MISNMMIALCNKRLNIGRLVVKLDLVSSANKFCRNRLVTESLQLVALRNLSKMADKTPTDLKDNQKESNKPKDSSKLAL